MSNRRKVTMWLLVIALSIAIGATVPSCGDAISDVAAQPMYASGVVVERVNMTPDIFRMHDADFGVVCYMYALNLECIKP